MSKTLLRVVVVSTFAGLGLAVLLTYLTPPVAPVIDSIHHGHATTGRAGF